ncbi:unnamed protein product, partial [Chrysoparadoxa australica]
AQGNDEDGDEYELVVASNESIQEIDTEIAEVYKYLVDLYGTKFPELDSIVTVRTDYVRTVLAIKNEMDITQVELENILPQTQVMVVSVTGTTTSGKPLSAENLEKVMTACDEYLKLVEAKDTNLAFVESRMAFIAPNLSVILGSRIAAQLMGLAGGLKELSKIPACNLQVMGQEKKHLAGFGAKAVVPHTGILYYCDMVQKLPHFLRMKGLRLVAAKAILAARGDSFGSDKSGEVGLKLIDQMEEKFKKWQEPEKTKSSKALPKPDSVMAKKRGGKRARNQKEKLQVTEVRKAQNRMGFASQADEYGDSAMGADFGMLGKSGAGGGRIRAPAKKEQKQSLSKRMRVATQSSGATGGMASSLVFTPVQGIELVNPMANDDKIKAANDKWFKKTSGFASAVPKVGQLERGRERTLREDAHSLCLQPPFPFIHSPPFSPSRRTREMMVPSAWLLRCQRNKWI